MQLFQNLRLLYLPYKSIITETLGAVFPLYAPSIIGLPLLKYDCRCSCPPLFVVLLLLSPLHCIVGYLCRCGCLSFRPAGCQSDGGLSAGVQPGLHSGRVPAGDQLGESEPACGCLWFVAVRVTLHCQSVHPVSCFSHKHVAVCSFSHKRF